MEQQSSSWLEWRKKGLGSSDAPIIMQVSPWKTPYQLWEEKTGKVKNTFKGNFATNRGNELEPIARARYEIEQGLEAPATLVINERHSFIRASLDGFNAEHGIVLEIKAPGRPDHEKALAGEVPEKYYPQCQHQLLACGSKAKKLHYYSFDGEKGVLVVVEPNREYQNLLLEKLEDFWNCITQDTPPPFMDRDFKKVSDLEIEHLLINMEQLQGQVSQLETAIAETKKRIFEHESIKDRRVVVDRWRLNIVHKKGNIDYANIPELQGVNLESYRKPSYNYRTIVEIKE